VVVAQLSTGSTRASNSHSLRLAAPACRACKWTASVTHWHYSTPPAGPASKQALPGRSSAGCAIYHNARKTDICLHAKEGAKQVPHVKQLKNMLHTVGQELDIIWRQGDRHAYPLSTGQNQAAAAAAAIAAALQTKLQRAEVPLGEGFHPAAH
jgi:hypothetical protein